MAHRIIKTDGGVRRALSSYDRKIRVRWSFEKKKWAIEAPVKRSDLMVPPVHFIPTPGIKGQYTKALLPELSDRRICYKDRFDPILWCSNIGWDVFSAIVESDTERYSSRLKFLKQIDKSLEEREAEKQKDIDRHNQDVSMQAHNKYKFITNRYPWLDPT